MTNLIVDDELAKRLAAIADRERRPLNDVLRAMADDYETLHHVPLNDKPNEEQPASLREEAIEELRSMAGMFDDDITDLSTTVRETLHEYFRKKYDNPD